MITLLIIIVILLAILLLKLGVDAAYDADGFRLVAIIGPLKLQILPAAKSKSGTKRKTKRNRDEPQKRKADTKVTKSLDFRFLLDVARLGLQALNRFRVSLRVDVFHLRFISASNDPYKTAMNCAYASAALNMLAPLSRRAFRTKDSKVEIGTDFFAEKPSISGRLKLTIRIWRILHLAFTFIFAFPAVWFRYKKRNKARTLQNKANEPEQSMQEHTVPQCT